MSRTPDDKKAQPPPPLVVRSDGEAEAQGYVEAELPAQPHSPTMEMERVHFTDPRRAPTMRREDMLKHASRKGSGPRAPDQKVVKPAKDPGVEAPEQRPATKMQALHFDDDLLEEMRAKLAAGAATRTPAEAANDAEPNPAGAATAPDSDDKSGPKPASPWSKDAPEAIRPSALPSSLRPRNSRAPGEATARTPTGDRGWTARAVVLALVVLAVALGLRAAFTAGPTTDAAGSASRGPPPKATLTAAAPTAPPTPSAAPAPSVEPRAVPSSIPSSAATSAPATSSPAPERHTAPKASSALEDPYSEAGVKPLPAVTAVPAAPTAQPTAQPAAPKTTATPRATATATSGDIF